jgi:hypothetical protein
MKANSHPWKFFRAGGFDQVRLASGADIANLDQLDQKLWVALACPTTGIEFDTKTLALIDTDNDGRVRVPEIIAAAKWVCSVLKNADGLLTASPSLPLSAINDATPEGRQLLSSAKQILANLGKGDFPAISVEETADTVKIFAQTRFNGDGIIPVDAASDEATKAVLNEIIACLGAETDRSGKPGVNQLKADQFLQEAQAFSDWWKKAEGDANILPIGEATATAAGAVRAVKAKAEDYFARCRLRRARPRRRQPPGIRVSRCRCQRHDDISGRSRRISARAHRAGPGAAAERECQSRVGWRDHHLAVRGGETFAGRKILVDGSGLDRVADQTRPV